MLLLGFAQTCLFRGGARLAPAQVLGQSHPVSLQLQTRLLFSETKTHTKPRGHRVSVVNIYRALFT